MLTAWSEAWAERVDTRGLEQHGAQGRVVLQPPGRPPRVEMPPLGGLRHGNLACVTGEYQVLVMTRCWS